MSETFLVLNGSQLTATDAELVVAFVAFAGDELSEEEMADWFRQHTHSPRSASRGMSGHRRSHISD